MMVRLGDAHGLLAGLTKSYPESIRPFLEVIGLSESHKRAAGISLVIQSQRVMFFADTAININPDAEALAEIAGLAAHTAQWFGYDPTVALLSI